MDDAHHNRVSYATVCLGVGKLHYFYLSKSPQHWRRKHAPRRSASLTAERLNQQQRQLASTQPYESPPLVAKHALTPNTANTDRERQRGAVAVKRARRGRFNVSPLA